MNHQFGERDLFMVGPDQEYQTIQSAYEDLQEGGGIIRFTPSYEAADETFPIQMDTRDPNGYGISVILEGAGGATINAGDTDENVLEIVGPGFEYQREIILRNFSIEGGNTGITLYQCPYSRLENLTLFQCDNHGVRLAPADFGTFGVSFDRVEAWECGGNGFRLEQDAYANATTFIDCLAMRCGQNDASAGVRIHHACNSWIGGVIQENRGHGLDVRDAEAFYLGNAYLESNGLDIPEDAVDVYLGEADGETPNIGPGVTGLAIDACRFNGSYEGLEPGSEREKAARAIELRNASNGYIRSCTYKLYGSAFVGVRGGSTGSDSNVTDIDFSPATHADTLENRDPTAFIDFDNGYRLRQSGTISPQDLESNDVAGGYAGDVALHTGEGFPQMVVWSESDESWYRPDGTTLAETES